MTDLIPKGCVSLATARELFLNRVWQGGAPTEELGQQDRFEGLPNSLAQGHAERLNRIRELEWQALVHPFADGTVEAFVRLPDTQETFTIPPSAWADMFFSERVFLASKVAFGHSEYWDAIADRTPFVQRVQLEEWLSHLHPERTDLPTPVAMLITQLRHFMLGLAQDGLATAAELEAMASRFGLKPFAESPDAEKMHPLQLATWSLPMAVAWIAWRAPDSVREQWDEYRKDCWHWRGFHRRLPVDGGQTWFEISGEELVNKAPASVGELSLFEAVSDADLTKVMSVKSAREALWSKLEGGELTASATDPMGNIVEIPAREWPYLELAHKDNLTDYLINRHHSLQAAYERITLSTPKILQIWRPVREKGAKPVAVSFQHDASHWNFFEACVWVGSDGVELPSEAIASSNLDEVGAELLFHELNAGRLVATGINRQLIRETIPAEYWELATTDPTASGHFVDFIDDAAEGFWGTLTPAGESKPRWDRINIEVRALKRVFPFQKAKATNCRQWLEECMRGSPAQRTMTKAAFLEESQARFSVSKADFYRIWDKALDNVPEAKPLWKKGGRPKIR